MLAAGTGGAEHLHLDILRADVHLYIVGNLRHDLQRGEGGLTPGGGVKGGDPDQPVHAVLTLEVAVGILTLDGNGGALEAGLVAVQVVQRLAHVAVALRPAGVHAEEHLRPVLGLGAARAGVKGEDGIGAVILAGEQSGQLGLLYLGLQLGEALLHFGNQSLVLGLVAQLAQGHQVVPLGLALLLALNLVP